VVRKASARQRGSATAGGFQQGRPRRKETLALPEPVGPFLALKLDGAPSAGGVQAGCDLGDSGSAVLAARHGEAGGLDGGLVKAGRDDQEEVDRADVELALGDCAREDGRIGKHETTARTEQASPLG